MRKFVLSAVLAATALASASAIAAADKYTIDPGHTFATFEIDHFGATTNNARFDRVAGTVTLDAGAKRGDANIEVSTTSISHGRAAFVKHLRSAELLDVEKFPTATFVSKSFEFKDGKVSEIVGQLTLHGQTQPVTLKATKFSCYNSPVLKKDVCGGDFITQIDRTKFGVDYGLKFGFPKEVTLKLQVEAIKN